MKKYMLSLMMFLAMTCREDVKAQNVDSFFDYNTTAASKTEYKFDDGFKSEINTNSNRAPLGGGLLLLCVLAMGYSLWKKNDC